MEACMPIAFEDIVGELMTARPATIRVFLDFRMGCVGCPISAFHSVDDACKERGIDRDKFLAALRTVADAITA
jgi:hybrid cluster-associated redox disulfide protein